jgi:hypothetical protein
MMLQPGTLTHAPRHNSETNKTRDRAGFSNMMAHDRSMLDASEQARDTQSGKTMGLGLSAPQYKQRA